MNSSLRKLNIDRLPGNQFFKLSAIAAAKKEKTEMSLYNPVWEQFTQFLK